MADEMEIYRAYITSRSLDERLLTAHCAKNEFDREFHLGTVHSAFTELAGKLGYRVEKIVNECAYCGTNDGLRKHHATDGYAPQDYVCEGCFTPSDTGPCFDDLPAA